jgi:SAM-dependent methyltransferase
MSQPVAGETIVEKVKERYGKIAEGAASGCCAPSCCGAVENAPSLALGYEKKELDAIPEGADLGLGCGAPIEALALKPGERVLDLGSGAGVDVFLAARRVGPTGFAVGVDMTPEMLERARKNAAKGGFTNVEFREGRLEALPVEDASIDAVTSNCVINLVPDKAAVFVEIARVLKPGGRVVVADIVLDRPLPEAVAKDVLAWCGCVAGASDRREYLAMVEAAGLSGVELLKDEDYLDSFARLAPGEVDAMLAGWGVTLKDLERTVHSITWRAVKR